MLYLETGTFAHSHDHIIYFTFVLFPSLPSYEATILHKFWIPATGCHVTSMDGESAASQAAEIEALQVRTAYTLED